PAATLDGERISALAARADDFGDLAPFDGFGDFDGVPTAGAVEER
ncbi:2-amino-4-hydroxy-6-hydroxymethyldihydropteridine diphosphokinase, partial [Pseudarthrobacter oxydans]|nr:2-amino-4-hydroxy-6-hydroxymethyldihydropteridine diphosphokinase [Pseudarthrobacter oxydans]